ncbi:cupin domain-containing protein [Azospirillum agricola]|uniref:cupin domain-containing protein n=1 Tax=Azospirillum agricola TaxID=1720247 RepID=UPI000A0F1175|nr:cupin domain-containing protein [Azospirillum agricola]SMH60591.1 Cupin domain-containing protein [Azospirillum lipoferum]
MRRPAALLALPIILLPAFGASAAEPRPMAVSCTVLMPAGPVPGLAGSLRMVEKLTVPPGHDAHRHAHDIVEYMEVLSGTGHLTIDKRPDVPLAPGVVVEIPPNTRHQQRNASDTEPLVYTATFIGRGGAHALTTYKGEKDSSAGCPHRLPR